MHNILTLSNIEESDLPKVGQRAVDLSQIHKLKFPVPLSFVVPNFLFQEFLLQNKLNLEIRKLLSVKDDETCDFDAIYAKIKILFEFATIPAEFKEELLEVYEALSSGSSGNTASAQDLLDGDEPIVNLVISPSYSKESEKFTGLLFNIQGFDNFLNGLKSCWLSLYSPEQLKFRELKKITEFSAGIIVEEFIPADCTIDAHSKGIIGNYELPISAYFGLPDITYSINKDTYSISKETFGITSQEIKAQEHILVRNAKSGTLIKRNLGKRGIVQKVPDKQIFEVARLVERVSSNTKKHFRLVLFIYDSKISIFFADQICERNVDAELEEQKLNRSKQKIRQESIINPELEINKKESLADLLKSPIDNNEDNPESSENKQQSTNEKDAFAWETTIKSSTNPEVNTAALPVKAIILDDFKEERTITDAEGKIVENIESRTIEEIEEKSIDNSVAANNDFKSADDFILAPTQETITEPAQAKSDNPAERINTTDKSTAASGTFNSNNEFIMSVILDLEPALDQEILKRYQDKFNKVPTDVSAALEELGDAGNFPEKEQIFKLKNMKCVLDNGGTINLDVFLDVTEKLRRIL